jgi:hypothetical protein
MSKEKVTRQMTAKKNDKTYTIMLVCFYLNQTVHLEEATINLFICTTYAFLPFVSIFYICTSIEN